MINKLSIIFFGIEWHAARLEWSSFVFFVLDSAVKIQTAGMEGG